MANSTIEWEARFPELENLEKWTSGREKGWAHLSGNTEIFEHLNSFEEIQV